MTSILVSIPAIAVPHDDLVLTNSKLTIRSGFGNAINEIIVHNLWEKIVLGMIYMMARVIGGT